jgi:Domain of unknown function (DUF1844)
MAQHRGDNFTIEDDAGAAIGFDTFVLSLATTALIHLGEGPDPETGKVAPNLVLAKQSLDLLELLFQKTAGNLTADEDKLFKNVLTDLRLKFVDTSKA